MNNTQPIQPDLTKASVLWLAPSYGYNNDFMYYFPILSGFVKNFKNTEIAVTRDFPGDLYPTLPLKRMLGFHKLRGDRTINGILYPTSILIPTFDTLWDLVSSIKDLYILIEFTPLALVGFLLAKLWRRRILLLIENDPQFRGAPTGRMVTALKAFVVRHVDVIMTNSEAGRKFLVDRLKAPEARILTKPYLTSDPSYARPETAAADPDAVVGVRRDPDRINALYLNSVTERKGLFQLASAVIKMKPELREKFHFHIVGTGDQIKRVEPILKSENIAHLFSFYGHVDFRSTWMYYASADIFISPSLSDYRSLAGFEALNLGKPIILSKFDGAHPEVVAEGRNGFVVDPFDAEAFGATLEHVASHPEQLPHFAAHSRVISEKFTFDKVIENITQAAMTALK